MLRTSLRSARAVRVRPVFATPSVSASVAARPWRSVGVVNKRFFADAKSPISPLKPPAAEPATAKSTVPPPSPPVRKVGFFRRLRNYILTLTIVGALAFGGGVWYSRINDAFHDFFTEYIPYGEQAVLYLEELDFQKRNPLTAAKPRDTGASVKVPAQSGASWRVAESESRQTAAVPKPDPVQEKKEKREKEKKEREEKKAIAKAKKTAAEAKAKQDAVRDAKAKVEAAASPKAAAVAAAPAAAATAAAVSGYKAPEVDEPSRWPPASPIDPLAVNDATDPVVQDIVHVLNDIITVINADKANEKFAATIGKAKNEVQQVGSKIRAIREAAEAEAAQQVQERTDNFDKAAKELVDRVEAAMVAQETQWQQQFDEEMAKARESYEKRVALAAARERELAEQEHGNKLLEQAVQLTQQFASELSERVEKEREGRLGKLEQLQAEVGQLEKLTAGWTDVVDASQRAQQLHVAIDAARARAFGGADNVATPGTPFVKELVAIKEIAATEPAVVDAAIASVQPSAYQRGIASKAELIERFRRVANEVRKASLLPEDAGVASHASSYVLSKVLFKRTPGEAALLSSDDKDVESILTRTHAFLEEGNLDSAAREMNGLTGWAKTLSRDWLGEVRKVLEVQQALDVITAEARLRSLQLEKNL